MNTLTRRVRKAQIAAARGLNRTQRDARTVPEADRAGEGTVWVGDVSGPGDHGYWRLERLRQAIEGIYAAKRAGA